MINKEMFKNIAARVAAVASVSFLLVVINVIFSVVTLFDLNMRLNSLESTVALQHQEARLTKEILEDEGESQLALIECHATTCEKEVASLNSGLDLLLDILVDMSNALLLEPEIEDELDQLPEEFKGEPQPLGVPAFNVEVLYGPRDERTGLSHPHMLE